MYLNLKTRRPELLVLSGVAVFFGVCTWVVSVPAVAVGGDDASSPHDAHALESRLLDLREEQIVRARREEILRTQLSVLEVAMDDEADEATLNEYRTTRDDLLELLLDGRRAEDEIASSIRELWDAQGYAERASRKVHRNERVVFEWPVEAALGISAHFDDPGYRARFGFAHKAIDIPVNQDSVVHSIADGIVEKVSDQGYGFNSIVIRHGGGYASLYGHVTEFLVAEGDKVFLGDPIARSGGMPGSKGAGKMTTGPHLHLELLKDGEHVDPLQVLPSELH